MKVWIRAHDTVLPLNFNKCTAVWSRMEGPIAGRYAANRMNECTDLGIWPDWGILKDEIENTFPHRPMLSGLVRSCTSSSKGS